MVLTEHTLRTSITFVTTEWSVAIFKFSCWSRDFLSSSAVEHFEGRGPKYGPGETWWAFGLQTWKCENGHTS